MSIRTIIAGILIASMAQAAPWFGVHVTVGSENGARALIEQVPKLAGMGVNVLIVEVNYGLKFDSHPELASPGAMSKETARAVAQTCRENKIRIIPQFNCLGHQSWSKTTFPLLVKYPQFDETPGQYPQNKDIYCRSWCPLHPEVNPIVFALMDELIDAFQADAFHVGMDEVFLIGSEYCTRCKGKDPAILFTKAVVDYHEHLVKQKHVEMLMWGDRLLDGKKTGYGKWEAAENGTQRAIDLVPKDIIMCDWHYTKRAEYPSIPIFIEKGFRVWPGGWHDVPATEALMDYAQKHAGEKMLGHLCTVWGRVPVGKLAEFPPISVAAKKLGVVSPAPK